MNMTHPNILRTEAEGIPEEITDERDYCDGCGNFRHLKRIPGGVSEGKVFEENLCFECRQYIREESPELTYFEGGEPFNPLTVLLRTGRLL